MGQSLFLSSVSDIFVFAKELKQFIQDFWHLALAALQNTQTLNCCHFSNLSGQKQCPQHCLTL